MESLPLLEARVEGMEGKLHGLSADQLDMPALGLLQVQLGEELAVVEGGRVAQVYNLPQCQVSLSWPNARVRGWLTRSQGTLKLPGTHSKHGMRLQGARSCSHMKVAWNSVRLTRVRSKVASAAVGCGTY